MPGKRLSVYFPEKDLDLIDETNAARKEIVNGPTHPSLSDLSFPMVVERKTMSEVIVEILRQHFGRPDSTD